MSIFMMVTAILLVFSVYVFFRLRKYIKNLKDSKIISGVYYIIWILTIIGIAYDIYSGYMFGAVVSWYMGVWIYLFMIIFLMDIIRLFYRKMNKKIASVIVIALSAAVILYGSINAYIIDITTYDIQVSKPVSNIKMVLISDTHYGGTQGVNKAKQMVEKINIENPDIVCYSGDIFDGAYDWVKNPDEIAEILSSIKSQYGVYACWGNHDVMGDMNDEMRSFLDKANIKLLEDDYELINNEFYVVGRVDCRDYDSYYYRSYNDIISELDLSKPVIVMDHRPKNLQLYAESGADILLSGHTHKGQLFPGNLIIGKFWENAYGVKKIDNMTSVTTSGVGLWGPPLRVGTESEIVVLNISRF